MANPKSVNQIVNNAIVRAQERKDEMESRSILQKGKGATSEIPLEKAKNKVLRI